MLHMTRDSGRFQNSETVASLQNDSHFDCMLGIPLTYTQMLLEFSENRIYDFLENTLDTYRRHERIPTDYNVMGSSLE